MAFSRAYVLRPKVAQERLEQRPDGLVRITLKKAYTDGTVAVDMDPLSLLWRLATSVPAPRLHTVRYAGVLAAARAWRPRIAPKPPTEEPAPASAEPDRTGPAGGYRPWAELLARTYLRARPFMVRAFGVHVTEPPVAQRRTAGRIWL